MLVRSQVRPTTDYSKSDESLVGAVHTYLYFICKFCVLLNGLAK